MARPQQTRRTVLKGIGGTAALGLAGTGLASARRPGPTIVEIAGGETPGQFNVLVAAVGEAGLVDALSGNRQFTVFAPTDEAFNSAGITVDNVGDLDDEFLLDVLTYHVSFGRKDAAEVTTSDELPTLNGATIDVDGTVLNDGQANIVATDIMASNGIVHVIDGVLLP